MRCEYTSDIIYHLAVENLVWGKKQIAKQVTTGILMGESIPKLADRLQQNIPAMNRTAAVRAARTAVTGAQNGGRQAGYAAAERMGIQLEKQWLATLDSRTRHDHAAADGQRAPQDQPFRVGGYELMYPGDPAGLAHEIYNCRCTMIAAVEGADLARAQRRARDPETGEPRLIPADTTYREWAAGKKKAAEEPAEIFRTMGDFVQNGKFDLEAAKADYREFLQSVPEKNKMYLEQAVETVDFQEVNHPDVVFGYSEKRDAILYNPKNPAFAAYDSRVVLTHELGHRIDCTMFIESRENQEFSRAIQDGEKIVLTRAQEFVTFCEQQDEDGFLSDIFSAVCKDKTRFPFWHDESYWSEPGNRQKETFANLFALETYQDTEKLKLLETNLPELIEAYQKLF